MHAEVAKLNANEWYFFSFRDRKYATGFRTNRATISGYWKATGKDRTVLDPITQEVVGMRKTLVFYRNRAPNGIKTEWIMHEFRLETPHMHPKEDWVLCRVFHKSKEDNKFNTQEELMYETPSLTLASSSPSNYQTIPISYNKLIDNNSFSSSITTLHHHNQNNSSITNHLLQYSSREKNDNNPNNNCTLTQTISSKGDNDGYGFFWNMDLEQNSLEDGVASNLDGITFEVDNNNNMIII